MRGPAVVLAAPFDEGLHAHSALRRRALDRLGCQVTTFDLLRKPGLLGRLSGGDLAGRMGKVVEQAAPDLVLVIGGEELDPETVAAIRERHRAVWANWIPWDARGLEVAERVSVGYDHLFAPGTDVAAQLGERIGKPVTVLPHACDPSVYRPIRSRDQYRSNVVFAGTASPGREALLTRVLEFGLAIWGPGWRKTSLKDYCRGEILSTQEFVRAYGGASVAVNIHHERNGAATVEASCNQRLFELAAIGVPQVVDQRRDLVSYFDPHRDCVVYDDGESLRAAVGAVLLDFPSAEEMAERARARALSEHTYMHRMVELLEGVGMGAGNWAED